MLPMIEEDRLQELIGDMCAYMRYLRDELKLYVSVHQVDQFASVYMHELRPFNSHDCPYCLSMKGTPELYDECVSRQKALCPKLGREPFFGTCWLGVGEYVFPLSNRKDENIGFISVSGYSGDPAKTLAQTRRIARSYGLSETDMAAMQGTLIREHPDIIWVRSVIQPLVYMFTIMDSYMENMGASFAGAIPGQSELFDSVCSFLRSHFSTDYKLSELARRFAVSESSLSRLFKSYSSYSYRGYVNAIRINIGKVYLQKTDVSIRELAELLGYSTPNYFTAVFQRECGVTPEQYRLRLRAK